MKERLAFCPCCTKAVAQSVFEDHQKRTKARLEADVAALAILDPDIPPRTSVPQEIPSQGCEHGPPAYTHKKGFDAEEDSRGLAIYKELRAVETEALKRWEALESGTLSDLSKPRDPKFGNGNHPRQALLAHVQKERQWMSEQQRRLQSYGPTLDIGNQEFATSIIEDLEQRINRLKLEDALRTPSQRPANIPVYDSGKHLSKSVDALQPATLVVIMMSIILNLLARVTRGPCNFVLRMTKLAIQAATNNPDAASDIPSDIRTARTRFDLDPVVTIFAVCSCGKLHKPTSSQPFPVYPATCSCGGKLTKATGHHNGVAIRKPIRPYAMQCFTDHRARMYARPGYETIIRRENILRSSGQEDFISDIREAKAYRELKGPDGRPFIDCTTEIRSIWSLSYDGYNPGSNKTAGKTASVGSLAMCCLSLPPSLRNRPENLYLVGLIPGPRQPSGDGLNPFLSPLVDTLCEAFHTGTFFTETYEHPEGITSREALLTVVNDLPGARKLVGGAGHSASVFCMYCHVLRSDINNIDTSTEGWILKTGGTFRRAAEDWRNATPAKRKELYKRNGIRWSELLRLEYWNPVQNTVIDGMHNLFLGLVRHHFREVIGTHWDTQAADALPERPPSEKELKRGRYLVDSGEPTLARLERLSLPTLHQIYIERAERPTATPGKKMRKRQLAAALLTTVSAPKAGAHNGEAKVHNLEDTSVPDIFSIDLGEGPTNHTRREMLDTDDLKQIQDDIKRTLRPWNQTPPPHNFGSPSHGKLKADEWRSCIEFDLPVSLVRLWGSLPSDATEPHPEEAQKLLALESTFLLAMAIRYAASHRTSLSHREKYASYMLKYLQSLLALHPNDSLHPNHHNALHIPLFLELFGPIQGWWMFPFERLIGILQRYRTNFKFGELEETVIKTFCASAHLKNLLDRPSEAPNPGSPPSIFQQSLNIVRQCLPDAVKGTMLEGLEPIPMPESDVPLKYLDQDIVDAFPLAKGSLVHTKTRIQQDGLVFASQLTSRPHCNVFFQPNVESALRPGVIREIFEFKGTIYLAVQCYLEKRRSLFDRFPDFGAEVWSQKLCDKPVVIPLSASVYPSYLRTWGTDGLVLKPMVSNF